MPGMPSGENHSSLSQQGGRNLRLREANSSYSWSRRATSGVSSIFNPRSQMRTSSSCSSLSRHHAGGLEAEFDWDADLGLGLGFDSRDTRFDTGDTGFGLAELLLRVLAGDRVLVGFIFGETLTHGRNRYVEV